MFHVKRWTASVPTTALAWYRRRQMTARSACQFALAGALGVSRAPIRQQARTGPSPFCVPRSSLELSAPRARLCLLSSTSSRRARYALSTPPSAQLACVGFSCLGAFSALCRPGPFRATLSPQLAHASCSARGACRPRAATTFPVPALPVAPVALDSIRCRRTVLSSAILFSHRGLRPRPSALCPLSRSSPRFHLTHRRSALLAALRLPLLGPRMTGACSSGLIRSSLVDVCASLA